MNANEQNAQEKKCVGQVSLQDFVNSVPPPNGGLTGGVTSGLYNAPVPNICPGCGRCRDCGRPQDAQPFQVPYPYINLVPFNPWPPTSPNWSGQATSPQIGGSILCQSNTNDSAAQDH